MDDAFAQLLSDLQRFRETEVMPKMVPEKLEACHEAYANAATSAIVAKNGLIIHATEKMHDLFGWVKGQLSTGRVHVRELIPPDKRPRHDSDHFPGFFQDPRPRQMGERQTGHADLKLEGWHKKEFAFPVEITLDPQTFEGELVVVANIVDMRSRQEHSDGSTAAATVRPDPA